MPRRDIRIVLGAAPLLSLLISCASFYNVPPVDIGFFEEAGEIQVAGNIGEKGRSAMASFAIEEASAWGFDRFLNFRTEEEVDSLVAAGRSVFVYRPILFGMLQMYDHQKSSSDSTDLREQREYNAGMGVSYTLYRQTPEGRKSLFGWLGDLRGSSSFSVGYGSIDSEYDRWRYFRTTNEHVNGTYLRPSLQGHAGISNEVVDGVRIEIGGGFRIGFPFFLKSTRTDTSLAGSALQTEFSLFARLLLLDFVAIEWQKASDSPVAAILSDWSYEYECVGLRILL